MEINGVVVDLETTGLDPKKDKIIEIGALKIRNGEAVDSFSQLVNPGRKLEQHIIKITGITDEELQKALYIEEILPKFLEFAKEDDLIGHSVLFDYSFLKRAAVNQGYSFERNGIDTLKIARKYLGHLESRSLPYLCKYYEIPHSPHRALSDVEATFALFQRLKQEYCEEENEKEDRALFMPQKLVYRVRREQPATKAQLERLQKLLQMHKIEPDQNINRMTRNEVSRYTDRILSGKVKGLTGSADAAGFGERS
ncbi:MAG: 3'-5' exonuclease [Lachnospiraceae bacterium]|jgi:DNA polymerase-3 subunit alpha (Gram-positive type)|nr:3'-5' exonuclease [Lachnospiraceae bacterium]